MKVWMTGIQKVIMLVAVGLAIVAQFLGEMQTAIILWCVAIFTRIGSNE